LKFSSHSQPASLPPVQTVLHAALAAVIVRFLTIAGGGLIARKGLHVHIDIWRRKRKKQQKPKQSLTARRTLSR